MRTASAISLSLLAAALFTSTAAFAQESPLCIGAMVSTPRTYVDPLSNQACMTGVNRVSRFTANPDTEASVQGRFFSGFDSVNWQSGSASSYFTGRARRHLNATILEPMEMVCEEDYEMVGPRRVVVETMFYYDDARIVSRNCADRSTSVTPIPSDIEPYMESVIHWDSPCGERPLNEVVDHETFTSIEELNDALDLFVQGECSF
jgi:hypothetical protein